MSLALSPVGFVLSVSPNDSMLVAYCAPATLKEKTGQFAALSRSIAFSKSSRSLGSPSLTASASCHLTMASTLLRFSGMLTDGDPKSETPEMPDENMTIFFVPGRNRSPWARPRKASMKTPTDRE